MFFAALTVLLKFNFFCIGIFIGILPETRYLLLAFYRYFRETLDSVIFLRPRWQPCICFTQSKVPFIGMMTHEILLVNVGIIIQDIFLGRCLALNAFSSKLFSSLSAHRESFALGQGQSSMSFHDMTDAGVMTVSISISAERCYGMCVNYRDMLVMFAS